MSACYFCGKPAAKGHDPGCPGLDNPESHRPVKSKPELVCGVDFGYAGSEVTAVQVICLEDDGGLTVLPDEARGAPDFFTGEWTHRWAVKPEEREQLRRLFDAAKRRGDEQGRVAK